MSRAEHLAGLTDVERTAPLLAAGGLGEAAGAKAELIARCAARLIEAGLDGRAAAGAWFVPGRLEVLGKHTDYAGGRSVVAAASQGICIVAVPREEARIRAFALDMDDECEFAFSGELVRPVGHWSNYPMTVARRLARNFPGELHGAEMAVAGDLPPAAGMSSSSALMIACSLVLMKINALADRDGYRRNIDVAEDLAGYLATVENGQSFGDLAGDKGVGTFGGSEDHTAILCSRAGRLSQYSYCPVRWERAIELPAGWCFAVAASGAVAEKTGEAMDRYNRASRRAAAVAEAWREATGRSDPHIAAALGSDEPDAAAERMRHVLAGLPEGGPMSARELTTRFEHFLAESEVIVPAAGNALTDGNLAAFGELVDRSQKLAETLLGNQIPQTSFLSRRARQLGAAAATGFGAGFGGSVWALVARDRAEALLEQWRGDYAREFPEEAQAASFFLTRPGPAAFEIT